MLDDNLEKEAMEQINTFSRDRVGISTLERYTGSMKDEFQPYILLSNFKHYVNIFSKKFHVAIRQGSVMRSCHSLKNKISIIDYSVGSPVAALITELISFVCPNAVLMLGMCGGLRNEYEVGDFFNPVAAIRGEGTSNDYMPPQVPALSSFVIQRYVCEELERRELKYHNGVIHTTNVRFWEFNEEFKKVLITERVQAVDMECATLFTVGFAKLVPMGALMLISDLPLKPGGVKTKESARVVFQKYTGTHLDTGIMVLKNIQSAESKGLAYHF
ncbi:MAG: AMP nucleosidase [Elusimicrobiota bacterium]